MNPKPGRPENNLEKPKHPGGRPKGSLGEKNRRLGQLMDSLAERGLIDDETAIVALYLVGIGQVMRTNEAGVPTLLCDPDRAALVDFLSFRWGRPPQQIAHSDADGGPLERDEPGEFGALMAQLGFSVGTGR